MKRMSHKAKHFLLQACKLIVIFGCLGYLTVLLRDGHFEWAAVTAFLSGLPYYFYLLLPVLSMASWLIESYKWQCLVRDLRELRFRESVVHNLTSQAASFITPLRAGEFAAKAIYFESAVRPRVLKAVLVGNMSQMLVTMVLGMAGLLILYFDTTLAFFFLAAGTLILMLLSPIISRWISFRAARLDVITGISFIRYLLFSGSWLVLLIFVSSAPISIILACITAMYFISSIVPTLQIFDVFLKWSVASFFIGFLDISLESMTALVAILWLNNTVLPVAFGCGLLAFQRFPKFTTA